MSIVKDLRENNIKCYDEDNFIYVDNENILKLNSSKNKDLILDIVGKSIKASDNAITLYKIISHLLPRKGNIHIDEALTACDNKLLKSHITSIRAMKELINIGVVKYYDKDKKLITLTEPYNFTNYLDKDIRYIIVENLNF